LEENSQVFKPEPPQDIVELARLLEKAASYPEIRKEHSQLLERIVTKLHDLELRIGSLEKQAAREAKKRRWEDRP
jgi:glycosyltransferase involved in cell wall biosynthesis